MSQRIQKFWFKPLTRSVYSSLFIFTCILISTTCQAIEISAGLGALEEGDDRGRGAAIIAATFANNWIAKSYVWGRSYEPVTETAGILVIGKRFDLSGSKNIRPSIGFSTLAEHTAIKYEDVPDESSSYTSTNFGLMLGMNYDLMKSKTMTLSASWDSHLFAAGQGIILLVTGRKQILGLTATITL